MSETEPRLRYDARIYIPRLLGLPVFGGALRPLEVAGRRDHAWVENYDRRREAHRLDDLHWTPEAIGSRLNVDASTVRAYLRAPSPALDPRPRANREEGSAAVQARGGRAVDHVRTRRRLANVLPPGVRRYTDDLVLMANVLPQFIEHLRLEGCRPIAIPEANRLEQDVSAYLANIGQKRHPVPHAQRKRMREALGRLEIKWTGFLTDVSHIDPAASAPLGRCATSLPCGSSVARPLAPGLPPAGSPSEPPSDVIARDPQRFVFLVSPELPPAP